MYVDHLLEIFAEVWRVLRDDGTLWLNLGDSYAGGGGGNYGDGKSVRSQGGQQITNVRNRRDWLDASGYKAKDLMGIPWMVAFALRADGWYLRSDVIWHKPNVMPSSVRDRPTSAHEYVFLFTKRAKYHYDQEAVAEDAVGKTVHDLTGSGSNGRANVPGLPKQNGNRKALHGPTYSRHRFSVDGGQSLSEPTGKRNRRTVWKVDEELWSQFIVWLDERDADHSSVWSISTKSFKGAHFAVFPPELARICILAGTSPYCCGTCGAPWRRVVERTPMVVREGPTRQAQKDASPGANGRTAVSGTMLSPPSSTTVDFEATCEHAYDATGRCAVLDPFAGASTVGVVCAELGLDYVGCEIVDDYVNMGKERIERS
jgi:DNA modification methylase